MIEGLHAGGAAPSEKGTETEWSRGVLHRAAHWRRRPLGEGD